MFLERHRPSRCLSNGKPDPAGAFAVAECLCCAGRCLGFIHRGARSFHPACVFRGTPKMPRTLKNYMQWPAFNRFSWASSLCSERFLFWRRKSRFTSSFDHPRPIAGWILQKFGSNLARRGSLLHTMDATMWPCIVYVSSAFVMLDTRSDDTPLQYGIPVMFVWQYSADLQAILTFSNHSIAQRRFGAPRQVISHLSAPRTVRMAGHSRHSDGSALASHIDVNFADTLPGAKWQEPSSADRGFPSRGCQRLCQGGGRLGARRVRGLDGFGSCGVAQTLVTLWYFMLLQ